MNTSDSSVPLAYLSGAMEGAPDLGREWRRRVKRFVTQELGHRIFDPTENFHKLLSDEEQRFFREWKLTNPEKFFPVIRRIIDHDLHTITTSTDYVICYWDEYVTRGAGTAAEISVAYMHRIPVYFITPLPLDQVSSWAVGCATEVFFSFRQLYKYLRSKYQKTK
ncbi:hypothetical protein J7M23_10745 [Candidatus Sumerlaeota bacterium]|nr:hypothetical protein [Candidatus Sumerlaeota bacterium]